MSCRPMPLGKPPARAAIEACRPRLLREVGSAKRQLTIALGNSALRSLLNNHSLKITSERGKAVQTERGVVLAAFHPAAILRAYGEYPRFVADLRYGAGFLSGQQIRNPGVTRWDLVTPQNFSRVVDFLIKQPNLGADIETGSFDPTVGPILCLSVAWMKNRAAVFPLMHPLEDPERCLFDHPRLYFDAMKDFLEAAGPRWGWHNGKYDTSFFQALGIDARVDDDTMLMHYALNEQRGTHDLAQLGADYLGAPNWKDAMFEEAKAKGYITKKSDSWAKIPPSIMYPYNARDADITYQLLPVLEKELNRPKNIGLPKLYEHLLIPASKFLQEVEAYGMWVSTEYLDMADEEYQARAEAEKYDILKVVEPLFDPAVYAKRTGAVKVPTVFNPGSPKQKLYVLRDVLGYRISDTQKETLEALPRNDLTTAILRWMKTNKVITTYIVGVQKRIAEDGRIHSTYLIHGTVTGRLSSRDPNMQNVPRDVYVRNIFQAPPGHKLVEFDFSQVELRILAVFAEDRFLTQAFVDGRDLHNEVSIALFGANYTHEDRIKAKFLNFGIAYGRGAKAIHEEFGMPMAEAKRMVVEWFGRAPEAATYVDGIRRAPQEGRLLKTPFGRRRRFNLVTRDNLVPIQNEAVNFAIQSTASDLTLLSAIRMRNRLVSEWGAHITNLVHDSILVEIDEGVDIDGMIEYVKEVMQAQPRNILHTDLPFIVDAKVGTRWGDFKE